MEDKRYYSVSYDERNYPEIALLRQYGGYEAYGRWEALKQLLFCFDGCLVVEKKTVKSLVKHELDFSSDTDLDEYLDACVECGLLDGPALERGNIIAPEVAEAVAYRKACSEAGKKSGEARRKKKERSA